MRDRTATRRLWRCAAARALALAVFCEPAAAMQQASPGKPSGARPASAPRGSGGKASPESAKLAAALRAELERAAAMLRSDAGGIEAAQRELAGVFDQVAAFADPVADAALFADAAFALRLASLVAKIEAPQQRHELIEFLHANPDLARALAFLVRPDRDKPAEVFAVLDRLRARHEQTLNARANLAAAICVVHDQPPRRQVNENRVAAPDAVAVYEYFLANEQRMLLPLRSMPAELLVYVVDAVASVPEMQWALQRYAGKGDVGSRFFEIRYDEDHFHRGQPKRVTAAGYTLPNILQHGGVCADQAHYAAMVGKSIGVPSAYAVGASGEVGHAWVGFLEVAGRGRDAAARWNFSSGRYEEYQGVRGTVIDPQTNRIVPDSMVSLLADLLGTPAADRFAAAALCDAARRLAALEGERGFEAAPPAGFDSSAPIRGTSRMQTPAPRQPATAEALHLLEAGLRLCPAHVDGWRLLQQLAEAGRLSLDDKKRWGEVLHRLCGERYPDFYLAVVAPMIETIDDVQEQNRLWNVAFKVFQNRHDLAAAVRMEQGRMWQKRGEIEKAGQCYEDVINRYANAGPFVLEALRAADAMLRERGDTQRRLALWQRGWSATQPPRDMAAVFATQSNWYRIGTLFAQKLQSAGREAEAAQVRAALGRR